METFDLLSITKEGTPAHVVALQATQLAKQARELGLNDQADMVEKSLYSSIKSRSLSGFEASKALAKSVEQNVIEIQKQSEQAANIAGGINAVLGYAQESGYNVDPDLIAATNKMYEGRDISGLEEMKRMISADVTRQADSKQKMAEASATGKMDPQAQIEANKLMATKLLRQFHNAQKILNDPEAPKAFTGNPTKQFLNKTTGVGNNVRSYMDSIGGFNLGVGMQEVKATTGTAAGMAASETEAFKAAQSALKIDQDWSNAVEQLNIFNSSIIRTLKGLGVRNEYLNREGAEKWLKGSDVNLPLLDNEKIDGGKTSQAPPPATQPLPMRQGAPNPQPQTWMPGAPQISFGGGPAPTGTSVPQAPPQAPPQGQSTPQATTPVSPYAAIRTKAAKQFNLSY